jgi:hypothetical protein
MTQTVKGAITAMSAVSNTFVSGSARQSKVSAIIAMSVTLLALSTLTGSLLVHTPPKLPCWNTAD